MIRFLAVTLAMLIAVTSQQMAMARGLMVDTSGQIVLCTGQGLITVTLDHTGEIVEGGDQVAHFCPDCTLTLADTATPALIADGVVVHMQTLLQTPVSQIQTSPIPTASNARGPPLTA
ncbi:hypothetical protein N9741_02310 [Octadecabacter sp.]|nr:hypothetical protein [Octadecabacter sp.]